MSQDSMDLEELASYIQRDPREVVKLASRGHLPGQKIGGEWRFYKVEINHWLERQMHDYTEQQLSALESGGARNSDQEPILPELLSLASVAVPLNATTKASVLRELVNLAEQSWQVYDPEAILTALRQREEQASTALPNGVAFPHPHRPLPAALGESIVAYGRTASGLPFGGPRGVVTDIFFLVCCRDDRTHLRTLARLSRLFLRAGFVDDLRAAQTPNETYELLVNEERQLLTV